MKRVAMAVFVLSLASNVCWAGPIDLGGYSIVQHVSDQTYTFQLGWVVEPGQYVIVARDSSQQEFEAFWNVTLSDDVVFFSSENSMPMINGDEYYELKDALSVLIDGPTVAITSGVDEAVARIDPDLPPGVEGSWSRSGSFAATPGYGAGESSETMLVINEFSDALGSGNYIYEYVELYYTPEPATLGLLGLGLSVVVARRKRRSRA